MAHIFKRPIAAIAKDLHARPGLGLHNRRQIDPAVIINIDRRNAPSAQRAMQRQFHSFKPPANAVRSRNVAPQRQPRRARVGDGDVHPAVLVVIQHGNAHRRRQIADSLLADPLTR